MKRQFSLRTIATALTLPLLATVPMQAEDKAPEFSKTVINVGIFVADADKAARFYTEAIGFTEVKGFSVTPELGRKIGLIDGHAVDVRVFALGEGDNSTKIKVLSIPAAKSTTPDQTWGHSTLGISYLTIYVADMERTLARLKKAGVKPIGETPTDLGGGTKLTMVRDPDGNFIELIGK